MKIELQDKLFKKYPKIFKQKDLPCTQTCLCWGLEIGDGWYELIDALCCNIQNYIDGLKQSKTSLDYDPQIEAEQVKEKFGGLRFYTSGFDYRIYGMISMAEEMSYHICESCGTTKNVTQNEQGWITTLCNECRRK